MCSTLFENFHSQTVKRLRTDAGIAVQFQFGSYTEYLINMVSIMYNHALKVC